MKANYRSAGRKHLDRAEALLEKQSVENLPYVALELRMAMECYFYSLADSYRDELPERRLSMWQPHRLLKELLMIDPHAGSSGELSMAQETIPGVAGDVWHLLGKERRMSLKEVNVTYHKLGNYVFNYAK